MSKKLFLFAILAISLQLSAETWAEWRNKWRNIISTKLFSNTIKPAKQQEIGPEKDWRKFKHDLKERKNILVTYAMQQAAGNKFWENRQKIEKLNEIIGKLEKEKQSLPTPSRFWPDYSDRPYINEELKYYTDQRNKLMKENDANKYNKEFMMRLYQTVSTPLNFSNLNLAGRNISGEVNKISQSSPARQRDYLDYKDYWNLQDEQRKLLEGANFRGSNLKGANVENISLKKTNLQNTNLSRLKVDERTNLWRTDIGGAQVCNTPLLAIGNKQSSDWHTALENAETAYCPRSERTQSFISQQYGN